MFKKILSFYTKYFAVWVLLFGVAAYICPEPFLDLEKAMTWFFAATVERLFPRALRLAGGMKWFFALTMFGIGAVLEAADFKRIGQRPIIVLIGCCSQFTIMPLGAFLLAKLFHLPAEIAVGLILTGSAPGAMASNVMSYIAKADTAYSVSLTTVSTLLCPLLTPGLTFVLAGSLMKVPVDKMMIDVVLMVIVPLFIGFGVRHFFKRQVDKILPIFPAISVTFIIFICSLVIALNKARLGQLTGMILVTVVVLNVYGMLAGYGVGSVFRMECKRRRTLSIEIGMQNAGLGTTLALAHFGEKAAIPAAIFVFVCIITASVLAELWQKKPGPEPAK
ncbi:MAG: bile acid:sodium symporter family protein [Planctomycetota bacterium]|jgi:BASS family bile acid:Na+ symporter